ncbi:hypothetical protein JRI60_04400 [Archangium violaceum]|uniref:P-loop NTPase fold protein n=1 Tax=Archangium violaceum TaxID=83451 RepID=UPI001951A3D4|nr:P-loop NTPase fold protein [Archangium violaceum]QRN98316.1 hypothetical protein JRI60_04400 [Archangium violaceum]
MRCPSSFHADGTYGKDLLDIDQDVAAFATLIAACSVTPPLSIGLFGEWGSGKTFFMRRIRDAVDALSREARDSGRMQRDLPFYKRIVQIEFNAWHYAEGNLWASLAQHIFENLSVSGEEDRTVTEKLQEHLLRELRAREGTQRQASQEEQRAEKAVQDTERAVNEAREQLDTQARVVAEKSKRKALLGFALPEAQTAVNKLRRVLELQPVEENAREVQAGLAEVKGIVQRGGTLLSPLLHAPDRRKRWLALVGSLLVGPVALLVVWTLLELLGQTRIAWLSALSSGVMALLTSFAAWARKQLGWFSGFLDKVEGVQRQYEEDLAVQLADETAELQRLEQELQRLQSDYSAARHLHQEAQRRVSESKAELEMSTASKLLAQYVEDRAASTDYRRHLGVLALLRNDFEVLSGLVEEENWRLDPPIPGERPRSVKKYETLEEEEEEKTRRINRIVLYIDDLDRCQTSKVVEVLEAVHLLLSFPLFVVVVSVDGWWLTRSLKVHFQELLQVIEVEAKSRARTHVTGRTTTSDYLEKIFQIPFWLKPMSPKSGQRMLGHLLAGEVMADKKESPPVSSGAPDGTKEPPPPVRINLESLKLSQAEHSFIRHAAPLLGRSPRALKRFVNVYHFIKAGLMPYAQKDALSDEVHQMLLFLLAVDTGLPRVSPFFFRSLMRVADVDIRETKDPDLPRDLRDLVARCTLEAAPEAQPGWTTLRRWLRDVGEPLRFNPNLPLLAHWASYVGRYSVRME